MLNSADNVVILSMSGQALLFLWTVAIGAVIGIFFDFFRILRKTVPLLAKKFVSLTDLLFWLAATAGMFYFMQVYNFGEIRWFALLGAACGTALYFATLSRFVMLVFVHIIEFVKKIVAAALRIIFMPLRILFSWLTPPAKRAHAKIRSGLLRLSRYGKIRLRKSARNLFILRKKV